MPFSPVVLLLMSCILPILAASVLVVRNCLDPQSLRQHGLELFASTAAFAFAVGGLIWMILQQVQGHNVPMTTYFEWTADVPVVLLHDRLSALWLVVNSAFAVVFCVANRRSPSQSSGEAGTVLRLLLFGVGQLFVVSSDLQLQWMLLALSNWLFFGLIHQTTPQLSRGSLPALLILTLSDVLLLLGFLGLYFSTHSTQSVLILDSLRSAPLPVGTSVFLTTSVLSMLLGTTIRLGLFPAMTTTHELEQSPEVMALYVAIPVGMGGLQLLRWQPLWGQFPQWQAAFIGLAMLSATLLGATAVVSTGVRCVLRLGTVGLSIAMVGLMLEPQLQDQMAGLIAAVLLVIVMRLLPGWHAGPALLTAAILSCGPFGVESVLQSLLLDSQPGLNLSPVVAPLLAVSLGVFCFGLLKHAQHSSDSEGADGQLQSPVGQSVLAGASVFGLLLLGMPLLIGANIEYRFQLPVITASLLTVSWLLSRQQTRSQRQAKELDSLIQVCRADYSLATAIENVVVIPVELAASMARMTDQSLFRWILPSLTRLVHRDVSEAGEIADRSETTAWQIRQLILTAIVLAAVSLAVAG